MQDKFEEYIRKNRAQLDVEDTDYDALWEGIQSAQTPKKSKGIWWVAAVLVPAFALLLFYNSGEEQVPNEKLYSLSDISPEFEKVEKEFQQDITEKLERIEKEDHDVDIEFLWDELEDLEEVNKAYRKDIGKVEDERLIQALLDYYEKKMRILEKILKEVERSKKHNYEEEHI